MVSRQFGSRSLSIDGGSIGRRAIAIVAIYRPWTWTMTMTMAGGGIFYVVDF
jgi:hypothetical protein